MSFSYDKYERIDLLYLIKINFEESILLIISMPLIFLYGKGEKQKRFYTRGTIKEYKDFTIV